MKNYYALFLLVSICFVGYSQNINDSLVAFYPFNGNGDDKSGFFNHGNVIGPTLTTDRFGNANSAYDFDGVNDYIEIQDNSSLDLNYNFSISFWFLQIGTYTTGYRIIDKNTAGLDDGYGVDTYGTTSGHALRLYMKNNADGSANPYSISNWHHGVVTYDQSKIRFYIDGSLDYVVNKTNVDPPKNSLPLIIGAGQNGSARQNFFKGKLDDLRVYRRTLDSADIKMLAMGPISSTEELPTVSNVSVYPNPAAQTEVTITLSGNVTSSNTVCVYDVTGRLLFENKMNSNSIQVPVQNFAKGIYIVKATNESGQLCATKFILE